MTNMMMLGTSGHLLARGTASWHVRGSERRYGSAVIAKPRVTRAFTQLIQADRCRSAHERVLDPLI